MTLEEKTIELQSQFPPLKVEQIIEILKNFTPDEEAEVEVKSDEQTPEVGNQDSSITPDPVVEQTNNTGSDLSDSGDGELVSQEPELVETDNFFEYAENIVARGKAADDYRKYKKKYETVVKQSDVFNPEDDPYQYKFEVNPEGQLDYYYKSKDDKDFILQEDTYASAKIAEKLNHLDKDQLKNLKKYEDQAQGQQAEIEMVSGLPTFDNVEETIGADNLLIKIGEIDSALNNFETEKVTKKEKSLFQYPDPETGEFKNEKTTVENQTVIKSKKGKKYFDSLLEKRKKLVESLKKEIDKDVKAQKEADKIISEMAFYQS